MPLLYAVTFKGDVKKDPFQILKLQLMAENQLHALKLALEKATQMQIKVTRVEEIGTISTPSLQLNRFPTANSLQLAG
ncbi:MAG TPA: hypothetical protein VK927_01045 [Adhaeribacter sp.]|nr:hypothetical protein [Adhaeribacter sp.]